MTWNDYQRVLANVLFWITRTEKRQDPHEGNIYTWRDRVSGAMPTDPIYQFIEGPDFAEFSALAISDDEGAVPYDFPASKAFSMDGDFAITFWVQAQAESSISKKNFSFDSAFVRLAEGEGTLDIEFYDGTSIISGFFDISEGSLPSEDGLWHAIKISRTGSNYEFQYDATVDTQSDPNGNTIAVSQFTIQEDGLDAGYINFFDIRLINEHINQTIFNYYRADVVNTSINSNNTGGGKTLPFTEKGDV